MVYTTQTKKALKVCFDMHKDQTDKSGLPYAFHPFHLAEQMQDEVTTVVALLHDVVEDTPCTFDDLRDITLLENGMLCVEREDGIPAPVLYMDAERRLPTENLYRFKNSARAPFTARLIPYFAFSNRGKTDMLIWTMVR